MYLGIGAYGYYLPLVVDQGEDVLLQFSAIGRVSPPIRARIFSCDGPLKFIGTDNTNAPMDANGVIHLILPAAVTSALDPGCYNWDFHLSVDGQFRQAGAGCFTVRWSFPLSGTVPLTVSGFGDTYYDEDLYPASDVPGLVWSPTADGFRQPGEGAFDTTVWVATENSNPVLPVGVVPEEEAF